MFQNYKNIKIPLVKKNVYIGIQIIGKMNIKILKLIILNDTYLDYR